jgi:hypothetical protein
MVQSGVACEESMFQIPHYEIHYTVKASGNLLFRGSGLVDTRTINTMVVGNEASCGATA